MMALAAPVLTAATDLATSGDVRLSQTYAAEAASLLILYKRVAATAWSTSSKTPAATVDISGLTDGDMYEFAVVAVDDADGYSLPSAPLRAVPTDGNGVVSRRIEENIVAALATILETEGYFDDVESVHRFDCAENTDPETAFFIKVAFDTIQHEQTCQRGDDAVDDGTMGVIVAAGRVGRDADDADWVPDSIHNMLAAVQTAIMTDPSRGGLAIDTKHITDLLRPEGLVRMADAVAAARYEVFYRTLRRAPGTAV